MFPDMAENPDENLYYTIMTEICDYGGDTDTNCAIVGTMIGPLIGYKKFKKDLFSIFINYIPPERTQFTSAFIYLYVNYLEQKILNKGNTQATNKGKSKYNKDTFNYTSFEMIYEFLNKDMSSKLIKK